jgi:hypothetical protein
MSLLSDTLMLRRWRSFTYICTILGRKASFISVQSLRLGILFLQGKIPGLRH